MALRQVTEKQLLELRAAARHLAAQLAAVRARVADELECMGVSDRNGSVREFLYRSECDNARRNAHALARKIDAIVGKRV